MICWSLGCLLPREFHGRSCARADASGSRSICILTVYGTKNGGQRLRQGGPGGKRKPVREQIGSRRNRTKDADGIAAMDLFVVPTISFRLLYGLLIMGHGRRQILWFGVTAHPTAEWIANQITEACGWEQAPRYLIRDRDGAYGEVFIRRLRSMGIRDRPTSPRSPGKMDMLKG